MEKRACGCGMRPKSKEEQNAELRKDAQNIVESVEGYSATDRTRRQADVKAAFPPVAKTTGKAVAKAVKKAPASTAKKTMAKAAAPAAKAKTATKATPKGKGPTPAGMSKGPHDGDAC